MDQNTINQITTQLADLQTKINQITDAIKAANVTTTATNPTDVFPATKFEMKFPSGKKGTIAYINGSGLYRKYTMSNEDVIVTPMGKAEDIITQIIEKTDVELINKGLVYQYVPTPGEIYFTPVLNQVYPAANYKVIFGNPYNPQGNISYLDGTGASKAMTKFGIPDTISATKFIQITNCKLVAL